MRIVAQPQPESGQTLTQILPFEKSLRDALNIRYPNSRVDMALLERLHCSGWILAINIALPYIKKPLVSRHIQWDAPTQEECLNMYEVGYILSRLDDYS